MNTQGLSYQIAIALMRVALLLALMGGAWSIYRGLPPDEYASSDADSSNSTILSIQLRLTPEDAGASLNVPVELYPVDIAAVRREYASDPRPGVRFDDFLKRRMRGRTPLEAQLNQQGQATVNVTPGKWWIHAVLAGQHNVEWRLAVTVYGRRQTVQLTSENAYARTKTF
ncbi:MAG TPA: hypothetical protein VEQ40_00580 [Pyrinomonadaceae bacterium]|nr:hypothetical protein [Pyrinomonadaceae bacterium]